MFSKKVAKRIICIFLPVVLITVVISVAVARCGKEESTPAKKKIIKKVIITSSDNSDQQATDAEDNQNGSVNDFNFSDSSISRLRRERATKEAGTVEKKYEPEYSVFPSSWNGPSGYVLVVAEGDRINTATAEILKQYFKKVTGTELQIVSDTTAAVKKEILVGDTNRYKTGLNQNEFAVTLKDGKLVFEGGHSAMVEKAADWFSSLAYQSGEVNTLTGKCKDFTSTKPDGYNYVWGDEFDGNALDMVKWCFSQHMSGTELMPTLTDENVVNVNEGLLKMTAIRYYDPFNAIPQYATNLSINTMDTMSYKYGYIEMRARVPYNRGAWPSFWFKSDKALNNLDVIRDYFIEVDVFEVFSSKNTAVPNIHKWFYSDTDSPYAGVHTQYNEKEHLGKYVFKDSSGLSDQYHIYGFEWTPTEMIMSIDGNVNMTYDLTNDYDHKGGMDGFHVPIYPILNNFIYVSDLSITGESTLVNNSDLPFEYFVDWIRLYQKSGVGELNLPENK